MIPFRLPQFPHPLVIGHRGACGYRPEHTLGSYKLAIALGADFIEPDLISTRDGHLIARHEPELSATTDVAEKFPHRRSTHMIDGTLVEGWFACDFTLAEIKTLRARQRWAFRPNAWDGLYQILTLEEIIVLAQQASAETGRTIGIYPETKHPTWHQGLGLALEKPLLKTLAAVGWDQPDSPVFIQSFEIANLQDIAQHTRAPRIQLLEEGKLSPADWVSAGRSGTYADMMTPVGLAAIADYAQGIGPWKRSIIGETKGSSGERHLKKPGKLIANAHTVGLAVHAYTFRDEPRFLSDDYQADPQAEYRQLFALGLDGVFSDFADTAVRARNSFTKIAGNG